MLFFSIHTFLYRHETGLGSDDKVLVASYRPTLEQAAAFISSALSAQPPDLSATLHLSFKAAAADKVEE